ncbi:MAG: 16S rRNA (cytosine(1402)-N(4))-methyltransferase RsmH [candidate division Zixibacteria bacterium]|nr:16S rRNA (cytosine(1402)-N(4))-methyltransferase RsmH [candidate division Zixibacteria bacterium]
MSDSLSTGGDLQHVPVMPNEVVENLITESSGTYLDATINGAGHAELMMTHLTDTGRLIGLDRDGQAVQRARTRLDRFGESRVTVVQSDYARLAAVCRELGETEIHGVLFDLGLSSVQLDDPNRGFGYSNVGPLDLRFDPDEGESAAAWLQRATESQIRDVLYRFGEEPKAKSIARAIVQNRQKSPIDTTADLWNLLSSVVGSRMPQLGRTAARVWQALRIQVNAELNSLPTGLHDAIDLLAQGGRIVVIAYHSLEDRIVKDTFREAARLCTCPPIYPQCVCGANTRGRVVTRRVLRPSTEEIAANSRARSARMRVFEKDVLKSERGAA